MFGKSCEGLYGPHDEFGPDNPSVDFSLVAVALASFAVAIILGVSLPAIV